MSKNWKMSGKRITQKNLSAAVAAGALCRRAGFIGIPLNHAASGASVSFSLEGVWGMTFDHYAGVGAGPLPAAGSILYWDTSASTLSNGGANDDYPAVKCVTAVSSTDGSFDGLLLPQGKPKGQDQS
jgi:predicted RecA/RadA family phage recombinase